MPKHLTHLLLVASKDYPRKCGKLVEKTGNNGTNKASENASKYLCVARKKRRNLMMTTIAGLLLLLLLFTCFVNSSDKFYRKSLAIPTYVDYYYIAIIFQEKYSISGTGFSNWRLAVDEFKNGSLTKDYYANAWLSCLGRNSYSEPSGISSGTFVLPVTEIKTCLSSQGKTLKNIYTVDSSENITATYTSTQTLSWSTSNCTTDFGSYEVGKSSDINAQCFYVEWDEVAINYYDQGGAAFSGKHESSYKTVHSNGIATSLDEPTKDGYVFGGWYLNDSTCSNASALVKTLSANETYETISLYAKWILPNCTLTLMCNNYGTQQYMIYIYKGDNIYMQFTPTKATETITLAFVDDYSATPYKVCFVFGYFGNITFESLTNGTASGRNVTLTTFADATISYKIATPNINSSIMV